MSQSLRQFLRGVRRRPFLTIALIVLLAFAVGVNVVSFSILDAVVLQAVPFPQAQQLFAIRCRTDKFPDFNPCTIPVASEIRRQSASIYELAYETPDLVRFDYRGSQSWIAVQRVSSSFFSTLQSWPAQGRWFSASDTTSSVNNLVVLSDKFWRSDLGARSDVVGTPVFLGGAPFIVCGVMPRNFVFPSTRIQAWILDPLTLERMNESWKWTSDVIVRTSDKSGAAQLQTELGVIARRIAKTDARDNPRLAFDVVPLRRFILGDSEATIWLLFALTVVLAVVIGANIANLLMARNLSRSGDHFIRIALGATKARLLRESLGQHLLLAVPVGMLAVWFASLIMGVLQQRGGMGLARSELASIGAHAMLYGLAVSTALVLLIGTLSLWPALSFESSTTGRISTLVRSSGNTSSRALQTVTIILQISLAALLLITATSAAKMLWTVLHRPIGFDPEHLLAVIFDSRAEEASPAAELNAFFRPLLDDLRHVPGVKGAALSSAAPLVNSAEMMQVQIVSVV